MTEHNECPRPRHLVTAVALIVDDDMRFLTSKRRHESGHGKYACPGGSVEFGEHPLAAAIREAREETGITLVNGRLVGADTDCNEVVGHWLVLFYLFRVPNGVIPVNLDPENQEDWEWWPVGIPPQPMFPNLATMISDLPAVTDEQERVDNVIDLIMKFGMVEGGRHKQWLLDQIVQAFLGELYGGFLERMPGWEEGIPP